MKHNWTYKKLGELVNIRTGKLDANAANENGKYPFFTCSREPLRINSYTYDCECVLVAGNGDLNVKYYNGKFDAYQRTYIIEKKQEVDNISTYYIYLFFQKYIDVLRRGSIGGIIKYIKLGDLTNALIPIPSLDEQQAIVRELDGINRLIDLQEEQLREYDRLAQSLFYTTFGDPVSNPKGWKIKKIGEICTLKSGDSSSNSSLAGSLPYVKVSDMNLAGNERYIVTSSTFVDYESNKRKVFPVGTTIFPKRGGAIFTNKKRLASVEICCDLNTMGVIPSEKLHPEYLYMYFYLLDFSTIPNGSSVPQINNIDIAPLPIPLPPLALQQSFAAQIETIEQQKALIRRSIDETRTLFAARMQDYFE